MLVIKFQNNENLKTLIYLAFYTRLISSDLLTIKGNHIDLEKRELRCYSPKRNKYRSIAFHEYLLPILKNRIETVGDNELLNFNCVENLGGAIRRYFDDIGVNKYCSVRKFRKTFITMAREFGMDASIVAELVCHEHQNTTDRFYNKISRVKMREELKKFPSVNELTYKENEESAEVERK